MTKQALDRLEDLILSQLIDSTVRTDKEYCDVITYFLDQIAIERAYIEENTDG